MVRSLAMALAVSSILFSSTVSAASKARGWEEQSWRSAYLAQQERWRLVNQITVHDPQGNKIRDGLLVIMRSGLTNHDDPAVDMAAYAPKAETEGPRIGYISRGDELTFFEGEKRLSGQEVSAWWKTATQASSVSQWLSWVAALPTSPGKGKCQFKAQGAEKTPLMSRCKWEGSTISWTGWTSAKVSQSWSMWVPTQVEIVQPDGSRISIKGVEFEVRQHGEGELGWPFQLNDTSNALQEPEVPLEDLDYQSW